MGDEITNSKYKESCQYFPTEQRPEIIYETSNSNQKISIKIDNSKTFKDQHTTRRVFNVIYEFNQDDGPTITMNREVEHIHYRSWVDMSIP